MPKSSIPLIWPSVFCNLYPVNPSILEIWPEYFYRQEAGTPATGFHIIPGWVENIEQ